MGADLLPFADNWAYLKTELSWLDRLLMLAIARQKKEAKVVNKVAKTTADRVSAHWWKGVIAVGKPAYDDCQVPVKTQRQPVGYQQQLESRIQLSAKDGIVLALPSLRHYLNLSLFEKNLILMAVAPEINRRYGRLYHYLQTGEDSATVSDLPTVDLALRLLCRNDLERRRARAQLTAPASLIDRQILRYVSVRPSTRLSSYLQLTDDWVNYLLAEQPNQHVLFERLATKPVLALPAPTVATRAVQIIQPEVSWDQLILPAPSITQLQSLCQQASAGLSARQVPRETSRKGQIALLVGTVGTGKQMAARAIATSLRQPLGVLDLDKVHPDDWAEVLSSLDSDRYPILLIKSAAIWFGRHSTLTDAQLAQWLQRRQASPGTTLLSVHYLHIIRVRWRQQVDAVVTLPLPSKRARTTLWRQAFAGCVCSSDLDLGLLAKQLKISGGEIRTIAQRAVAITRSKNTEVVTLGCVRQVIAQRGK